MAQKPESQPIWVAPFGSQSVHVHCGEQACPAPGCEAAPKPFDGNLPEEMSRLGWGRFAARREQARSLQGAWIPFAGVGVTTLMGLRDWLFGGLLSTLFERAYKCRLKTL